MKYEAEHIWKLNPQFEYMEELNRKFKDDLDEMAEVYESRKGSLTEKVRRNMTRRARARVLLLPSYDF